MNKSTSAGATAQIRTGRPAATGEFSNEEDACGRQINLEDGWLVGEAEGERLEVERAARDADGELLVQELRGEEQGPLRGPRPELHHVAEADPGLAHGAPPRHLLGHRARHGLRRHRRRRAPSVSPATGGRGAKSGGLSTAARRRRHRGGGASAWWD